MQGCAGSVSCAARCGGADVFLSILDAQDRAFEALRVVDQGAAGCREDAAGGGVDCRRHDFVAFRAKDASRPDESTIVVVNAAEVGVDNDMVVFRIEASHFLWKMVRRLAGTLWQRSGWARVSVEQFAELIEGRKTAAMDIAAWTAPGSGLFLESVRY